GGRLLSLQRSAGFLSFGQPLFGGFDAGAGFFLGLFGSLAGGLGLGTGFSGADGGGFSLSRSAGRAFLHLAQIANQPLGRLVTGGDTGGFVGQLCQLGLDLAQRLGGLIGNIGRGLQPLIMALSGLFQLTFFPDQPLDHLASVAVQRRLALDIAVKLGDARQQRLDRLRRAGLGLIQSLALNDGAGQDRGGNLFLFPQGGQFLFGLLPGGNGAAGGTLGLGSGADRSLQRLGGRSPGT